MHAPKTMPNDRLAEGTTPQIALGHQARKMPDMRVVTKGWWVLREKKVPVEKLQQEDRDERK